MTPAIPEMLSMVLATAGLVALVLSSVLLLRGWQEAIPVVLELWTAAGLLRLTGEPSWNRIAGVAAIVALRQLIVARRASGLDRVMRGKSAPA